MNQVENNSIVIRCKNFRFKRLNNFNLNETLFCLCIFIDWLIFAFSRNNIDRRIYENWYNESQNGLINRFEIGLNISYRIGCLIGLTYQQFLAFFSAILLIIFSRCILKYSSKPLAAGILYFIYPFFYDVIQFRNFAATVIVLFGIRFLKEYSVRNITKYIITIFFAMCFHKTAIIYLVFILAYFDFKKIFKIVIISMLMLLAIIAISKSKIVGILSLFGDSSYLGWNGLGNNSYRFLGYFLLVFLLSICVYMYTCENKNAEKNNFILKIIPIIMLFSLPLLFASQTYRFVRDCSIFIYIAIINEFSFWKNGKKKSTNSRIMMLLAGIAFVVILSHRQLYDMDAFKANVAPIIESNSFFVWLAK